MLSTSHDVNFYNIKAENILLCGKILSVAIQPVTVIHNFPLNCIGGVILSPGTGTAWKNNMSNDQEVAKLTPNPVLKAHYMK